MVHTFIKPEKVAAAQFGLLVRESVLARLVWRDAAANYTGAKNDTITLKLPAYAKAKKRALRSGAARVKSQLHERSVDVKLDTDIYMDVPVSDEQMTLDISDFGGQILNPMAGGTVRSQEEEIYAKMAGATYADNHEFAWDLADIKGSIAHARELLNKANVPMSNRTLVVGSEVDTEMIQVDNFVKANESGTTDALREAILGRIYGFTVVTSPLLDPGEAFALHSTAFALASRAPLVPAGAPWGTSQAHDGFAVRFVRVFDPNEVEDRVISDMWCGVNVVTDAGAFDAEGRFEPAEDPNESGVETALVRAVHLTPDLG